MPETPSLTREQILSMPAGRQIDARVHELVMRLEPIGCIHAGTMSENWQCPACGEHFGGPNDYLLSTGWWGWYSTDVAEALNAVAALKDLPGEIAPRRGFYIDSAAPEGYRGVSVAIGKAVAGAYLPASDEAEEDELQELTALAICRAALLSVIPQVERD